LANARYVIQSLNVLISLLSEVHQSDIRDPFQRK
jgi:hypothetical protein